MRYNQCAPKSILVEKNMIETAEMIQLQPQATSPREESLYAELKRIVDEKGLFRRQPLYYGLKIPIVFAFLILGWTVLFFIDNTWLCMLDALFVAFMTVQVAFIGHDAGHQQIFGKSWMNDVVGLLNGFSVGASYSWWVDTHNRHHGKPNQFSCDPAIDYYALAFSEEQLRGKGLLARSLIKYQAFLFVPMLMLYPLSMRIDSIRYFFRQAYKYRSIEILSLLVYFPLYFFLLFYLLGFWQAILFAMIHQAVFGLYLSSVFIPNHMGMPMIKAEENADFLLQQVITARNVKGPRIVDFLFGGLNYQIEHHLFPRMARNHLRKTADVVREFLRERSISYYEVGIIQSYREIFESLHRVAKSV